jgi:hypothetical protein
MLTLFHAQLNPCLKVILRADIFFTLKFSHFLPLAIRKTGGLLLADGSVKSAPSIS